MTGTYQIHLYPMAVILAGQFMHCAISTCSSPMVFFVCVSWRISWTSSLRLSTWLSGTYFHSSYFIASRERREHRVFEALLQVVPGLQEQLLEAGENDVVAIAEMVCLPPTCTMMHIFTATGVTKRRIKCSIWWHQRFERSHPGLDRASGSITQPTSCS